MRIFQGFFQDYVGGRILNILKPTFLRPPWDLMWLPASCWFVWCCLRFLAMDAKILGCRVSRVSRPHSLSGQITRTFVTASLQRVAVLRCCWTSNCRECSTWMRIQSSQVDFQPNSRAWLHFSCRTCISWCQKIMGDGIAAICNLHMQPWLFD